MADTEIANSIAFNRFSSIISLVPLILYLPIGLALCIIRVCIFLHASLLYYILPNNFPLKRWILRVMLSVIGLPISTQGVFQKTDSKKIVIANHVTNLDPFILNFLSPIVLTLEGQNPKHSSQKPENVFQLPADKNHDEVILAVKDKVRESDSPLLFFPEKVKTNGTTCLLKFSRLPFEVDSSIQPITIQVKRYLFDISVSTYTSSAYEDLFWCFVLPVTFFQIKYLPVTEKKKDESKEEFADRVQANMAKSLGISASSSSHNDVTEYFKKMSNSEIAASNKHKAKSEPPPPSSPSAEAKANPCTALVTQDSELETMVKQVKDVLPDTPAHCILADLKKTRDVDLTITNILEGLVDTSKPAPESAAVSLNSLSHSNSFKASKFESSAASRQLSFAERKQAMLEAARLKYRIKHGL